MRASINPPAMLRAASLSRCQTYRWTLTRRWGDGPHVCWIMLNPSQADHCVDDPTIRRVIHFTRSWGFDGLCVVNLYPFRTPHPASCRRWAAQPGRVLHRNLRQIAREAERAAMVVAAWGSLTWDPVWIETVVRRLARELFCLGITRSGAPKHPLARGWHRVPDDQRPMPWRGGSIP